MSKYHQEQREIIEEIIRVCMVAKRGTGKLYAMKYMNKAQCRERNALNNVLNEVEILSRLEHPFLVNLWFSFQDEEDFFMVSDLFMGGDLRYHIQQGIEFTEDCIHIYVSELALALDYLKSRNIVHRDVKPDNVLLDERGHAHLTDFNIATVLRQNQLATSMTGTKPYMAPEIFECLAEECAGYSHAVDWWSLGVCAYEMLALYRPYDIHSTTSLKEVRSLFSAPLPYPAEWSRGSMCLIDKLLTVDPGGRVISFDQLKEIPVISKLRLDQVLAKEAQPIFVPPKDSLNCDPSLELEEMIIEERPLHKKKKRLAKQRSLQPAMGLDLEKEQAGVRGHGKFLIFNREQEIVRKEREKKELEWEKELLESMRLSEENSGMAKVGLQSKSHHSLSEKEAKTLKKSNSCSYPQKVLNKCPENEEINVNKTQTQ